MSRGDVGGSGWGRVCLGPYPGGMFGVWPGVYPGPHLGGPRPTPDGYPVPDPGVGLGGHPGPAPGGGVYPACTEADSHQQTTVAAGGTHPTGKHSCLFNDIDEVMVGSVPSMSMWCVQLQWFVAPLQTQTSAASLYPTHVLIRTFECTESKTKKVIEYFCIILLYKENLQKIQGLNPDRLLSWQPP